MNILISISIWKFNLLNKNEVRSLGLNNAYISGIIDEIDKNSNMLEKNIAINTNNLLLLSKFVIRKKELI